MTTETDFFQDFVVKSPQFLRNLNYLYINIISKYDWLSALALYLQINIAELTLGKIEGSKRVTDLLNSKLGQE